MRLRRLVGILLTRQNLVLSLVRRVFIIHLLNFLKPACVLILEVV